MVGSRIAARRLRTALALIAFALIHGSSQAGTPVFGQPSWSELSSSQQRVLQPLSADWDNFESWRKKKWLDIADKYPRMRAEERERVQQRMKAWAKLTPEERQAARDTFRNVQKASSVEREALRQMWTEYESLPAEEKQRFQASRSGSRPTTPQ